MTKEEKWITFTKIPDLLIGCDFIIGVKYKIKSEDALYYYLPTKIKKDLENKIYITGKLKRPLNSK